MLVARWVEALGDKGRGSGCFQESSGPRDGIEEIGSGLEERIGGVWRVQV